MNLKELFNKKSDEREKDLKAPKVVIDDIELTVTLGQWFGIIHKLLLPGYHVNINSKFFSENLIKELNIKKRTLEKISVKFGQVLALIGIDESEVCILKKSSIDDYSFNCHFNNSGDDATISLIWGAYEIPAEICFNYKNTESIFEYYETIEGKALCVKLKKVTIEKGDCKYERKFSHGSAMFEIKNSDYSLSIDFKKQYREKEYIELKNENELKEYMLSLKIPVDITGVYKKIREISPDFIDDTFRLNISLVNNNTNKVTDSITVEDGKIIKLIRTKDDKTISVDANGYWSCTSSNFDISQNEKGVSYSEYFRSSSEMSAPAKERYEEIIGLIDKAKNTAKNI